MDVCKRGMGAVGASESIGGSGLQFFFNGIEVARRQDAVGIQYDEIFPPASLGTVIAGLAGAGVGLIEIVDVQ